MAATARLPVAYLLNCVRSIYRLLELAASPGGWHGFEIGERLYSKRDYFNGPEKCPLRARTRGGSSKRPRNQKEEVGRRGKEPNIWQRVVSYQSVS